MRTLKRKAGGALPCRSSPFFGAAVQRSAADAPFFQGPMVQRQSKDEGKKGRHSSRNPTWDRLAARPGEGLGGLRSSMESAFDADFSSVRLHRDSSRALELNARAATQGEDIYLAPGEGDTSKASGRQLLGHELAHVIQQGRGGDGNTYSSSSPVLQSSALELNAERAGHSIARGRSAVDPGRLAGTTGPVIQLQPKPGKAPAPPPSPILYVGMHSYEVEVKKLKDKYKKPDQLTTVTASETESATDIGTGTTFDLKTAAGIEAFAKSFNLDAAKEKQLSDLLKSQPDSFRDDIAHLVKVYADTQASPGTPRMTRVVLSGHSGGLSIFGGDNKITFQVLINLKSIFPAAAEQVQHVMLSACNTGDQRTMEDSFVPAFPNVRTIWAYAGDSPEGADSANAIVEWSRQTEGDVHKLAKQGGVIATWSEGKYEGPKKMAAADALAGARADNPLFESYFNGTKVDADPHSGPLHEYYLRVSRLAGRPDITGADHNEMQSRVSQALRLRFYPKVARRFVAVNHAVLAKGYGSAPIPDFTDRKKALQAILDFPTTAQGTNADKAAALDLLQKGLRDLSPSTIPEEFVDAPETR